MENYKKLYEILDSVTSDVEKTKKGNETAGIRVRKVLQELKTTADLLRKDISTLKRKNK